MSFLVVVWVLEHPAAMSVAVAIMSRFIMYLPFCKEEIWICLSVNRKRGVTMNPEPPVTSSICLTTPISFQGLLRAESGPRRV